MSAAAKIHTAKLLVDHTLSVTSAPFFKYAISLNQRFNVIIFSCHDTVLDCVFMSLFYYLNYFIIAWMCWQYCLVATHTFYFLHCSTNSIVND